MLDAMRRHSSLNETLLRRGDSISRYKLTGLEKEVYFPRSTPTTGVSQIQQGTGVSPSIFVSILSTYYKKNIHSWKSSANVSTRVPSGSTHQPLEGTSQHWSACWDRYLQNVTITVRMIMSSLLFSFCYFTTYWVV